MKKMAGFLEPLSPSRHTRLFPLAAALHRDNQLRSRKPGPHLLQAVRGKECGAMFRHPAPGRNLATIVLGPNRC